MDPVKANLSTSMCPAMAAPADGPMPGKIFTTPSGKPTWKHSKVNKSVRSTARPKRGHFTVTEYLREGGLGDLGGNLSMKMKIEAAPKANPH